MCKARTIAVCTLAISCLAIGAAGGFKAGDYLTGQRMEKRALAHDCATIDPRTLAFSWKLPISMDIAMDALPDIAPVKSKKAVAK